MSDSDSSIDSDERVSTVEDAIESRRNEEIFNKDSLLTEIMEDTQGDVT